jgi:hypothetical protein
MPLACVSFAVMSLFPSSLSSRLATHLTRPSWALPTTMARSSPVLGIVVQGWGWRVEGQACGDVEVKGTIANTLASLGLVLRCHSLFRSCNRGIPEGMRMTIWDLESICLALGVYPTASGCHFLNRHSRPFAAA